MRAKKSLGQHFLTSESALVAIIEAGSLQHDDTVLEIGPGKGVLTRELLTHAGKVIAIEKDRELVALLSKKFTDALHIKHLILIEHDILTWNSISTFSKKTPYKIIANIPYYITGAILEKFLSAEHQPQLLVLLVQKEVAQRIVARDGKESILSLSVKVYGEPRVVKIIPRGAFTPTPTVDSAILAIANISRNNFVDVEEAKFFTLVKKGFGSKRKFLRSNLGVSEEVFMKCDIPLKARAEDLTLQQWLSLAHALS